MGIFEDLGSGLGKLATAALPYAQEYFRSRQRPMVGTTGPSYPEVYSGPPIGSWIPPTAPMGAPQYVPSVRPVSLPGTLMRTLPQVLGGVALGELAEEAAGWFGGGGGAFFAPATGRARPMRTIVQMHPETGAPHWWEHRGRPIAYTSDLSAARRLARCARFGRTVSRHVRGASRRRRK